MRLKKKSEFTRVFRAGTRWKGRCFSLHLLRRPEAAPGVRGSSPRLGIVVTRKVGNAVERNRIKRRIREAFRMIASRLPAIDLVLLPNASCKDAGKREIASSLERAVEWALGKAKEKI